MVIFKKNRSVLKFCTIIHVRNLTLVLLMGGLIFSLVQQIETFAKKVSPIAAMEDIAGKIKPFIHPKPPLSLLNADLEFWYKMQLAAAPVLLENNGNNDSLLLVVPANSPPDSPNGYTLLQAVSNHTFRAALLKNAKSR
jgi:hypothetical protein